MSAKVDCPEYEYGRVRLDTPARLSLRRHPIGLAVIRESPHQLRIGGRHTEKIGKMFLKCGGYKGEEAKPMEGSDVGGLNGVDEAVDDSKMAELVL